MAIDVVIDDLPGVLERLDDVLVGLFGSHAGEVGHAIVEYAVQVHRAHERQTLARAGLEVVFAERRGLVNDAGAGVGRDVLRGHDSKRPAGAVFTLAVFCEERKQRLVSEANQLGARAPLELLGLADLSPRLELREQAGLDPRALTRREHADLHVGDLGVHGEREVARQRPRCGGPGPQERAGLILEFEANGDAGVVPQLVAVLAGLGVALLGTLRDLEIRERGAEQGETGCTRWPS